MSDPTNRPWLLLLHQIPAKPDYLRVKVWRRMQRLGAVPLKNSVWALPSYDAAMEDFQWLIREIEADGGDALLCEARILAGLTADQTASLERAAMRGAGQSDMLMDSGNVKRRSFAGEMSGRTWVTRQNVHVDRIASAWLIRRFIDGTARFRFEASEGFSPEQDEIRFDMYDAEYTHVGDACTFEVLASTFVPDDPALAAIAQIVHDIDLKDARFGRPETPGVELMIDGIVAANREDDQRIEKGSLLLDHLYAGMTTTEAVT